MPETCAARFAGRYGGELTCELPAAHPDRYHHDPAGIYWAAEVAGTPAGAAPERFREHVEEAIRDIPASCQCAWYFSEPEWRWIRRDAITDCPFPHPST